ncbi:MAG: hypothetical protein DI533_00430 [Cereibacter sphaeroides]|uniref:Uncharacterized protein n=1 Tax=Cereibacter sphaeroides TaxID=1063 RepID=A0A2W5SB37_CERSP|nr:MAG: hypothetical protein DI533_00430 [Cereibacter sphaeroides]
MQAGAAVPLALGSEIGTSLLGGMAGRDEAKGEQKRAEANSFVYRTRAIQTSTAARAGLNDELATLRATLAGNGQRPGVGTYEIMRELRDTRKRERRVAYGNEMAASYNADTEARIAKKKGQNALIGGFAGAAKPAFSLYDLYKKKA